jgi:hypothetical protein
MVHRQGETDGEGPPQAVARFLFQQPEGRGAMNLHPAAFFIGGLTHALFSTGRYPEVFRRRGRPFVYHERLETRHEGRPPGSETLAAVRKDERHPLAKEYPCRSLPLTLAHQQRQAALLIEKALLLQTAG